MCARNLCLFSVETHTHTHTHTEVSHGQEGKKGIEGKALSSLFILAWTAHQDGEIELKYFRGSR